MAHTNSTPNYNLPQFLGTDKPAWLTDINTAMSDIDTAIAAAKTVADTANIAVGSLSTTVGNHTTQLTTLSGTVTSQGNTLNTVTALIGNGVPTTTDQTIIGAINEINDTGSTALSLTPASTFVTDTTKVVKRNGTATVSGYCQITGTLSANSTIANLPAGYRPAEGQTLIAIRTDASVLCPVNINTDGSVTNSEALTNGYYVFVGAYNL